MIKKTGYTVNTMQEIMFRGGARSMTSSGGSLYGTTSYDFATSDYIADTSIPEANYRIDVEHFFGTNVYTWHVLKTEDSKGINVVDWWQGSDMLSLWFVGNSKDIRVIISP
jgi:hypothetical protein